MELSTQVDQIVSAVQALETGTDRCLIAIAGPPASGKSTLAEQAQRHLMERGHPCGLVPMDGFHLDNDTLRQRGLLSRKGAPETFDVSGFGALIRQLGEGGEVTVPLFDRAADCVLPDAARITQDQRHVIVEGNYLLLNSGDWRALHRFWSLNVFVAPPMEILEARLVQRWVDHGMDLPAARQRARQNDLVNAKAILEGCDRAQVDLILS